MAKDKLSTEEILALARRQGAFGGAQESSGDSSAKAEQPDDSGGAQSAAAAPAEAPSEKPAAAPKSTGDILAAARAQGGPGGGGSKPAQQPKSAGDKPKSTADILAAARAQGSGGGGAQPAAAKTDPGRSAAAKPKPNVRPDAAPGDHPSVKEMVRALHEGRPESKAAAPAKSRLPSKPPLPKKTAKEPMSRRTAVTGAALAGLAILATPFAAGWTLMAIIGGLWSLLTARFMMPNMVVELPSKFKVGPPSDFPPGAVSEKFKASRGVWIVNSAAYSGEQLIYALFSVCTHLGCTPNWLEGEQKFKCPCHGSGFYISGINFEGPAPRPLERAGIRLAEDGSLEVDKSVKFQEELGQWQDPTSYFQV